MNEQLAVNSKHTGDPSRDHRGYAEPMTAEQIDSLLGEQWLREMVADIRGGDEKKKDLLPFVCPHYRAFRNNHRAQADILPEMFTYMTCVDVDDLEMVERAISRSLELNSEEGGDWQDQVLRIEYSARRKVHIYIRIPVGKTIEEAQQAFCAEIDVPYDESCTTPERFIYLTGRDEEVYRSPHWLEPLTDEELEERREAYLLRGLDVDGRKLRKDTKGSDPSVSSEKCTGDCNATLSKRELSPCAVEATERTRFIFRECMKEEDVTQDDLTKEGCRHTSVKVVLSHCNQLLTEDETLGVLRELMPEHWNDKNIRDLVHAYYTDYMNPHQRLSQVQKRIFRESKQLGKSTQSTQRDCDATLSQREPSPLCTPTGPCTMERSLSDIYSSDTPPVMPAVLPRLVKLLTRNTPEVYKPTVAHAIFPPLGVHMRHTQFRYTDNVLHEPTLMSIAMAGTGGGKGCVDEPINRIMADIRALDEENTRRLNEFNKESNRKGANKDRPERPDDLVIQEIDADVTHAAFVQRLDEAQDRFLYFKLNEIEMFDKLKGSGGQQFTIICQAFDPNNRYGQTRASSQSVNAKVQIRFNWNAAGTIGAVTKYFAKVLTKGPISRINFCTIPEREIGAPQPIYGTYDAAFDEQLKPYLKNLATTSGIIECRQARLLAKRLIEECAEFSILTQDRVFENLSFRANVIAWLKACVLYVANGCKWEKSISDFIRWSLHYDLWCKMRYFADGIRREEYRIDSNHRGPSSLMIYLPDEFTVEDVQKVRRDRGLDASRKETMHMIRSWLGRNKCAQSTEHSYEKADKYKSKTV